VVRDRVIAGRHSRSELKSFAFEFLSEYFLSLLAFGLVLRPPCRPSMPMMLSSVITLNAPARRSFRYETNRLDSRRSAEIGKQSVGVTRLRSFI
jgi:hypothetical protein